MTPQAVPAPESGLVCTVTTLWDTLPNVKNFVGRNLAAGVDHMFVFLDAPAPAVREYLSQVDEVTVGLEIIAQRVVRVMMRNWISPSDGGRGEDERPFFAIYLPAQGANRNRSRHYPENSSGVSGYLPATPALSGARDRIRTGDLRITNGLAATISRYPQQEKASQINELAV